MKKFFTFVFLSSFLLFDSCDVVDDPWPPNLDAEEQVYDDSTQSEPNNTVRYVLLEDFTGHTCNNCPRASRQIKNLKNRYGKKLVAVAVHTTDNFASPKPGNGGAAPPEAYTTDHRAPENTDYLNEQAFAIDKGLPRGMVSRRGESITDNKWRAACDEIFNSADSVSVADINIKTYFHNPTGTFRVDVEIEWLEDYAGDMNLQIQVVEDSVVDWQLDGSDNIEDYVHNYLFRGSVNSAWGSPIDAASAGSKSDTSFTRTIDNYLGIKRQYNLDNYEKADFHDWYVVAFLYKQSPEFEVMQVNKAYLTSGNE